MKPAFCSTFIAMTSYSFRFLHIKAGKDFYRGAHVHRHDTSASAACSKFFSDIANNLSTFFTDIEANAHNYAQFKPKLVASFMSNENLKLLDVSIATLPEIIAYVKAKNVKLFDKELTFVIDALNVLIIFLINDYTPTLDHDKALMKLFSMEELKNFDGFVRKSYAASQGEVVQEFYLTPAGNAKLTNTRTLRFYP